MAAIFGGIGVLHFLRPASFDAIIPDPLPAKRALTYATGAAEVAGAAALVARPTRTVGWALAAFLLAVFPANVHQAVNRVEIPGLPPAPPWAGWVRLPFQAVMIWAVLAGTRPDQSGSIPRSS
jgi:uncharacterized membrane protein